MWLGHRCYNSDRAENFKYKTKLQQYPHLQTLFPLVGAREEPLTLPSIATIYIANGPAGNYRTRPMPQICKLPSRWAQTQRDNNY